MKNRIYYILILSFIAVQACKPNEERVITLTFENGDIEQEKIYPNGRSDSLNYNLIQYNPNGSIEMEGKIRNGKEQGTFTWYYPNGNKKWIEKFNKGVSIDTIYCFYESGRIKRKAFPPKKSIRKALEYFETGELKIISFINNGNYIDSSWTGFYKNGKVKEIGKVNKAKKIGTWKFYDNKGNLIDSIDQTGKSKVVFDFEEEELKYDEEKSR